jgi:hypothetical protein
MPSKADTHRLSSMPWLLKTSMHLKNKNGMLTVLQMHSLHLQQTFQHTDSIAVGNGSTFAITNFGSATLHAPYSEFSLNNVLHCPKAAANLISIQCFCLDNHYYFILTATHFYIFDLQTQALLLEGKSENDMYPIQLGKKSHRGSKAFITMLGIKTTPLVWHFRLDTHPLKL